VVLEHWDGKQNIKELISNVASVAEYFLPRRMKNVLRGRIEPKGRLTVITDEPSASEQS
jgi:hypothetical protein